MAHIKFVCPITDLVLQQPCLVTTCMWWSEHPDHKTNCCHGQTSDAILAKAKRISVEEVERLKKQGQSTISSVLILYEYRSFLQKEYEKELSLLDDVTDTSIEGVLSEFPYTYDNWKVSEFLAACVREHYQEFSEYTAKTMRMSVVLAAPAKILRAAETLYFKKLKELN